MRINQIISFLLLYLVPPSIAYMNDFCDLPRAVESVVNCNYNKMKPLYLNLVNLTGTMDATEMRSAKRAFVGYLQGILEQAENLSNEMRGIFKECYTQLCNPALMKTEIIAIFLRVYKAMRTDASQLKFLNEFLEIMTANEALKCTSELLIGNDKILNERITRGKRVDNVEKIKELNRIQRQ
jgi:hypothetical protein